MIKDKKD